MSGALLPLLFTLALQTPPAPVDPPLPDPPPQSPPSPAPVAPPVADDPADKAFRDELITERIPFPPVLVEAKRIVNAAAAVKRKAVDDATTVIGVTVGGESRAYPIEVVSGPEALNDVVGGTPILVSWCVRCQAAVVFSRTLGEQTLTFGCQRAIWRGSAVLYDVESGSLWSQPIGRAGAGALRERVLAPVASVLTAFGSWRAEHPDTTVLVGGATRRFQRASFYVWDAKSVLRLGIVVRLGAAVRLYPLASSEGRPTLYADEFGELPVAVVFAPEQQVLQAFRREIGGTPVELVLELPAGAAPLALREVGGERRWRADSGRPIVADGADATAAPALERLVAFPLGRTHFAGLFPDGTIYDGAAPPPPAKKEPARDE